MRPAGRSLAAGAVLAVALVAPAACTGSSGGFGPQRPATGSAVTATGTPAVPGGGSTGGGTGSGPATHSAAPSSPGAAEGVTAGAVKPCPITSPAQVRSAFGASAVSVTVTDSPLGGELCTFHLTRSAFGRADGVVVMSEDTSARRADFDRIRKQLTGGVTVRGVGDAAFYVNDTGTLQFIKGHTGVTVQARFAIRAGTRYAAAIQAAVVGLTTAVADEI